MADPRSQVSFEGIGFEAITYPHDDTIVYNATLESGSAQAGLAVTLETNGAVSLVGDGEEVEGRLIKVESDGFCVVQTHGHQELPAGDGATVTAGRKIVGDLGAASAEGYIRNVNTAVAAELGVARGRIIDASDTTAVIVEL